MCLDDLLILIEWVIVRNRKEQKRREKRSAWWGVGVKRKDTSWSGQVTLTAFPVNEDLSEEPLGTRKSFDKMAATSENHRIV